MRRTIRLANRIGDVRAGAERAFMSPTAARVAADFARSERAAARLDPDALDALHSPRCPQTRTRFRARAPRWTWCSMNGATMNVRELEPSSCVRARGHAMATIAICSNFTGTAGSRCGAPAPRSSSKPQKTLRRLGIKQDDSYATQDLRVATRFFKDS